MAAKKAQPRKPAKKTIKKTAPKPAKKAKAAKPAKKTATASKKATKKVTVKTKTNLKTKTVKAKKAAPVKTQKTMSKTFAKAAPVKSVLKPVVDVDYGKVITPLLDRVVVKVLSGERITAGGLIIPDSSSMATGYLKAEVLAVGHGIKTKKGGLRPLDVKVGDTVLFSEYAGAKVKFNSEELTIINESDVMGIVQRS